MPNILNKDRKKLITSIEQTALGNLTQGETIPAEYIPAVNVNNVIDSVNGIGDPNKTGVTKFTQAGFNSIVADIKLNPSLIAGNTNTSGKINSSLIEVQESSEIGQALKKIDDEVYTKDETINQIRIYQPQFHYKTFDGSTTYVGFVTNNPGEEQKTYTPESELLTHTFNITRYSTRHRLIHINFEIFLFAGEQEIEFKLYRSFTNAENPNNTLVGLSRIDKSGTNHNMTRQLMYVDDMRSLTNAENKATSYYFLYYKVPNNPTGSMTNLYRGASKMRATSYFTESN